MMGNHMNNQNGGFGKRGLDVPPPPRPEPRTESAVTMSPLLRQIGGMAIGVAMVIVVLGVSSYSMKQMGKRLDQGFSEQKAGISPLPDLPASGHAEGSAIQTCATPGNEACK
jgi:hypothetical protein